MSKQWFIDGKELCDSLRADIEIASMMKGDYARGVVESNQQLLAVIEKGRFNAEEMK